MTLNDFKIHHFPEVNWIVFSLHLPLEFRSSLTQNPLDRNSSIMSESAQLKLYPRNCCSVLFLVLRPPQHMFSSYCYLSHSVPFSRKGYKHPRTLKSFLESASCIHHIQTPKCSVLLRYLLVSRASRTRAVADPDSHWFYSLHSLRSFILLPIVIS
jgi:hypothetical protein